MVPAKSLVTMAVAVTWLVVGACPAAAEWFTDLYGGLNVTESHHFSLDGQLDGVATAGLVSNVSFDKSFLVGGRVGHWFESPEFFGLGLDVSYFRPDIGAQTKIGKGTITDTRGVLFKAPINVSGAGPVRFREVDFSITAVSFDLMLRWPMLVSTDFPHGRLQPYLTIGPGLYIQHLERFDTRTTHGLKVGGGVAWELTRSIGLFAEYRYTHVRAALHSGKIKFRTHLSTHHFLSGISFRF
jgi:opacity protein-like surface antigen